MNNLPKILIIPARRHIAEAYCEYLIRYLGDEFHFEMGYPPEAIYYDKIKEGIWSGVTSPFNKNPNEFDLIYPQFDSHWFLDPAEKYAHKVALVYFEPHSDSRYPVAIKAGTSEAVMKGLLDMKHNLRFGVDTNLFSPFPQARPDNLVHVGFMGNVQTPRRYIKDLFINALKDVEGIKLDVYPTNWPQHTRVDEIEGMGGQDLIDNLVDGDKWLSGLPNLYNQMDIYIRCDIDHGYQYSVLEAASCGVPVVCVDSGPSKEVTDAGGGICIDNGGSSWQPENLERIAKEIREAVISLRDNPYKRKEMGRKGRKFIKNNYTWDKLIPAWREFFKEGLKNAKK